MIINIMLISIILSACGKDPSKEMSNDIEGFMPIGQKYDVKYIQHKEYNKYDIGIMMGNHLWWYTSGNGIDRLDVSFEDNIDHSYIERVKNFYNDGQFDYDPNYILHVKNDDDITAGTYKKMVGKNQYQDVQTQFMEK